jgi:hypothetical protein
MVGAVSERALKSRSGIRLAQDGVEKPVDEHDAEDRAEDHDADDNVKVICKEIVHNVREN